MKTAEILRTTKALVLYPPPARIKGRVPIYTIPAQGKYGAGKKAFIPDYPDSFFKNTQRIDKTWLLQRMKEIAAANSQPQILVADIADHEKEYELAKRFANLANKRGQNIDLNILKIFTYAHDLGRVATGGKSPRYLETLATPYHGVIGREIFINFAARFKAVGNHRLAKVCLSIAKMCSSHTAGTGFPADINRALGIHPHGKRTFEDDLVWGEPRGFYLERLLAGVSDAKNFYPSINFSYNGKAIIYRNSQDLIEITDGRVVIDGLVSKIFIVLGTTPQTLIYRDISDWMPQDEILIEFGEGSPTQRMALKENASGVLTLYIEGSERKVLLLPAFEVMGIGGGAVDLQENYIASREAVHARFDHFHKRNKANIDRVFSEVIQLVGEENRGIVDEGWFDPKRIPA